MVQIQSVLKCNDNSGILFMKCLHIVNKTKKEQASVGNIIKISILQKKKLKFKKQQKIYYGLILGLRKKTKRYNGIYIRENSNRAIVLNFNFKFLGTRIYGPISKELKKSYFFLKIKPVLSLGRGSL